MKKSKREKQPKKARDCPPAPDQTPASTPEEAAARVEQEAALRHLGFALQSHKSVILLALGTLLLKSLIFEPINIWPVSFICLVPWLLMMGWSHWAPRVYLYSYLMGLAFFLWNMRWLIPPTGLGYVALSMYLACYFPLMACPIRHAMRRRRMPLAIVVPIVWTGQEMLRAVVISGFPWFFLSHTFADALSLIQTSDLVGAYGVSFMIAAVNGAVADVILARVANKCSCAPETNRRQA